MDMTKKELRKLLKSDSETLAQLATDIVLELADRAEEAEEVSGEEE